MSLQALKIVEEELNREIKTARWEHFFDAPRMLEQLKKRLESRIEKECIEIHPEDAGHFIC